MLTRENVLAQLRSLRDNYLPQLVSLSFAATLWQTAALTFDKHSDLDDAQHDIARCVVTGLAGAVGTAAITGLCDYALHRLEWRNYARHIITTFVMDALWQPLVDVGQLMGSGESLDNFGAVESTPAAMKGAVATLLTVYPVTLLVVDKFFGWAFKKPTGVIIDLSGEAGDGSGLLTDSVVDDSGASDTSRTPNLPAIYSPLGYTIVATFAAVGFYFDGPIDLAPIGGSVSDDRDIPYATLLTLAGGIIGQVVVASGVAISKATGADAYLLSSEDYRVSTLLLSCGSALWSRLSSCLAGSEDKNENSDRREYSVGKTGAHSAAR